MKKIVRRLTLFLVIASLSFVTTCNLTDTSTSQVIAQTTLAPTQGNSTTGSVTFTTQKDGVSVVASITGLAEGKHGFHIHENGDCSAPDGTSAGGHFNTQGTPHGSPDASVEQRHVGDLGNILVDVSGSGKYDRVDQIISLSGTDSIVGKAVIIHSGEDDLTSQPTGNAGSRLACGIIELQS